MRSKGIDDPNSFFALLYLSSAASCVGFALVPTLPPAPYSKDPSSTQVVCREGERIHAVCVTFERPNKLRGLLGQPPIP